MWHFNWNITEEMTNSNINYFRLMEIVKVMEVQFENPVWTWFRENDYWNFKLLKEHLV